ncbi:MAG: GspE/PulE family protein [Deltaproteobacteria bacterium]|nr:GspE/PulE family protein [Deltaproteobacteria bacterium]
MAAKSMRIGEILISEGLITPDQLNEALREGEGRVGKTLIRLGYVTDEDIARALANQFNLSFINLSNTVIPSTILSLIPETIARKNMVIPVSRDDDSLTVAVADPLNVLTVDELTRATNMRIRLAVATENDIMEGIDRHYLAAKGIEEFLKTEDLRKVELLDSETEMPDKLQRIADDDSVVRLVNMIISQAVESRASDIHIEPASDVLRVRFRVDGILHDAANLPVKLHPAVTSRIKILGNMDIAEKRHPQDGRFVTKVGARGADDVRVSSAKVQSPNWEPMRRAEDKEVDVRVSTLPTTFGEKVELRLLDKGSLLADLDELSPCVDSLELMEALIKRPYGMLLITGPTGSGKTTTIYSLLGQMNAVEKNIVTVEDPIEYQMKRINQVQVNPKAGLTFADALRHILRQDPDVIMIGEIRDRETAEIAIHAALTGHFVLSSLHTTDASGAIGRLIDMGIEPFLASSAIIGIGSQRLVKKICPDCKESYKPDEAILKEFGLPLTTLFYKGKGCGACKGEGYRGRIAIIEVLRMGEALRKLTLEKADSVTIRSRMTEMDFPSLRDEGIKAVVSGITTIEEVIQATQELEEWE